MVTCIEYSAMQASVAKLEARLALINRSLRRVEIHQHIEWADQILKDDFYACIDLSATDIEEPNGEQPTEGSQRRA